MPTSPSSWSGTRTPTRASTSATRASTSAASCPRRTTRRWSNASKPRPRPGDLSQRRNTCGRGATRAGSPAAATAPRCASGMTRSRSSTRSRQRTPAQSSRSSREAPSSSPSGTTRSLRSCSRGTRGWKGATRSPTCCSAWSTSPGGCRSPCPSARTHLPSFDRDASHFVYDRWHGWWKLARDGNAPAYPFGFGLELHDVRVGEARRCELRHIDRHPHDGPQHRVAKGHRRRAGVFAEPTRLVGFARVRGRPGRGRASSRSRCRSSVSRCATSSSTPWWCEPGRYTLRAARVRGRRGHPPRGRRSGSSA